jgi:hypothetical protein
MRYVVLLLAVLLAGCGSEASVNRPSAIRPELRDALEAEIAAIRADPASSVGFGEKGYAPYEPNVAHGLITVPGEDITARLQEEIEGSRDRVYRLALLHVLGRRRDERVDQALMAALEDPDLRATAAYLLGRAGFKPYPARPRDEDAVRAALRRYLDDDTTFDDPFYRQSFRVGDFVLGAYIRLTGPKRFTFADRTVGDDIGYELPRFGDQREDLLSQAQRTG